MKYVIYTIIALSIVLRCYKIQAPVADWHSFRQVDTASVAQLFLQNGIQLFEPRYHDVSNIQSGFDNPNGYRMVELPLYQATAVLFASVFHNIPLDVWLRIVSIAASAGIVFLLYNIVRKFDTEHIALLAALVYAILPFSIFYGRAILPETFAVFWAMFSVYMLLNKQSVFISGIFAALALLSKPTAGFLLLPAPYLLYKNYGVSRHLFFQMFVYSVVSVFPFLLWRQWILQFPEGIAVYNWLFNKDNIRFKGAWFHWLFAKRIGELILGFWGLIPFGIGLFVAKELFYIIFGLGGLLYLVIFASGNVQHDYYQVILIPIISMYVAKGIGFMVMKKDISLARRILFVGITSVFCLAFSWYTIRTYYWINRPEIIEAGMFADRVLPKDAKVIAPYNGDTTFLYQTKRIGWPIGFDIADKIEQGATAYVTVSPSDDDGETKALVAQFHVIERNEKFAIIDLTKPK